MAHLETQDLEPSEVAFGGADAHRTLEPVSWSKVRVPPVQSPAKTPGGKCRGNLYVPLEVRINGFFSPTHTLWQTNIAMEWPTFWIGNTSSKGPFSVAMLDYWRINGIYFGSWELLGVYLGEITHCSVLTIDPITSNGTIQVGSWWVGCFPGNDPPFLRFWGFFWLLVGWRCCCFGWAWLVGGMLLLFYFVVFSCVCFANHRIRRWMLLGLDSAGKQKLVRKNRGELMRLKWTRPRRWMCIASMLKDRASFAMWRHFGVMLGLFGILK